MKMNSLRREWPVFTFTIMFVVTSSFAGPIQVGDPPSPPEQEEVIELPACDGSKKVTNSASCADNLVSTGPQSAPVACTKQGSDDEGLWCPTGESFVEYRAFYYDCSPPNSGPDKTDTLCLKPISECGTTVTCHNLLFSWPCGIPLGQGVSIVDGELIVDLPDDVEPGTFWCTYCFKSPALNPTVYFANFGVNYACEPVGGLVTARDSNLGTALASIQ